VNLKPLKVIDDTADGSFSSSIIVRSLNEALKNIGLYDEKGESVVSYSTIGSDCGRKDVKAIICLYELAFPEPVLKNLGGRPVIGSGLDNMHFAIRGGYPASLCHSLPLGVDSKFFQSKGPPQKNPKRVICVAESNTRCGLHHVIEAFGKAFCGRKDVELYIKDRFATERCQSYLKYLANLHGVENFIHDTANTVNREQMRLLYESATINIFLNNSSTWALSCVEGMSMGLPLIAMNHSGPGNYIRNGENGFTVEWTDEAVDNKLISSLINTYGYRNFLFDESQYFKQPFWASPNVKDAAESLHFLIESDKEVECLSSGAIATARQFTWERSAAQLATIVASLK